MSAVIVLLLVFAANSFSNEWAMFRYTYPGDQASDFRAYYVAAKLAGSREHHQLYYPSQGSKGAVLSLIDSHTEWGQIAIQSGIHPTLHFNSPPTLAVLLSPIGKLPFWKAFFVWRVLTSIFFFLAICATLRVCRALNAFTLLVCTFAGFTFQPFTFTLDKGQFGPLLLLLWSAGIILAERKWDIASALLFALATIVKLTPALVLGIFLLRRRWKWTAAYGLWMVLLVGVGVWQLGIENHRLYTSVLRSMSCGVPGRNNYSLPGIVQDVYYRDIVSYDRMPADAPARVCTFSKVLSVATYLGTLIILLKRNRSHEITWDLVVFSILILLLAPFTWRHYYVLELLPLMFTWFSLMEGRFSRPNRVMWIAIGCTLVASTAYLDFLQAHLTNGPIRVVLISILPLSALLLMLTLLCTYRVNAEPRATAG